MEENVNNNKKKTINQRVGTVLMRWAAGQGPVLSRVFKKTILFIRLCAFIADDNKTQTENKSNIKKTKKN